MKFPVFTAISSNLVQELDFFLVQKLLEYLEWHSRPCSTQSLAKNSCISNFRNQISFLPPIYIVSDVPKTQMYERIPAKSRGRTRLLLGFGKPPSWSPFNSSVSISRNFQKVQKYQLLYIVHPYLESILQLGSSLDPSNANFIVAVLGSSPTSGNLNLYFTICSSGDAT